jgi:hypothetical protein
MEISSLCASVVETPLKLGTDRCSAVEISIKVPPNKRNKMEKIKMIL